MSGVANRKRGRFNGRKPGPTNKKLRDAVPKPEGAVDGPKRTPLHLGDGYRGHPSYEVQEVVRSHIFEGRERYKVKWVGIPSAGSTWEPEGHLIGEEAQAKLKEFVDMREKKRKVSFVSGFCSGSIP